MSRICVSMITGIIFIGLSAGTTAVLAAAPSVFTAWKKITLSQDECMQQATAVLSRNGYANLKLGIKGNNTILGGLGDYTGLVRCAAGDPGLVIIVVAGPSENTALDYLTALYNGI